MKDDNKSKVPSPYDSKLVEETGRKFGVGEQVYEVRILGGEVRGISSGYFDCPIALAAEVESYHQLGNVYISSSPVHPSLQARAKNQIKDFARHTTSDREILFDQSLLVDIDPVRPSGISATREERAAALVLMDRIAEDLNDELGVVPFGKGSSGNGGLLLYRLDAIAPSKERTAFKRKLLHALGCRYNTDSVKIDEAVSNPSRLVALPGSLKMKGDTTNDRPHRLVNWQVLDA
jgi:hypothetical protein